MGDGEDVTDNGSWYRTGAAHAPSYRRAFLLLAALAFCTYCIFDFAYLDLETVFPDEERFIAEAVKLHDTGEFGLSGQRRAWEMPLTAAVNAVLYGLAGSETGLIVAARLFQAGLLLLQALLTLGIARLVFRSELAGLIAGAITLFYPFFVYYQGLLLSEPLFNVLLVAAFYFLYRWNGEGQRVDRFFFLTMTAFGLAVYTKGVLSVLPPILLSVLVLCSAKRLKRAAGWLLLSGVVYALILSPWWMRNYMLLGHFIPFTTSSAWVLHSGNNPANQTGGGLVGIDVHMVEEIERLPEVAWYQAYKSKALEFMMANPRAVIELAGKKFLRFWRLYPSAEGWNTGIYKWGSLLSYGVVLLFALIGAVLHRRKWPQLSPIYALILGFTAIHMVFFGSIRYRLPLEPFLIVIAAGALSGLAQVMSARAKGSRDSG